MADTTRPPLTRTRILEAAVDIVDRKGIDALTMRRLGTELGVEAMSLYKHVANKDEILDGIIELVVAEIETPDAGDDWHEAMRRRAASAREVLRRHSWAIGLLEARGERRAVVLGYLDAVLGALRSAGFSVEDAGHAFWLLDSFVYGHVLQEVSIPIPDPEATSDDSPEEVAIADFAHLSEVADPAVGSAFSFDREFEFGLELILNGLDQLRESQ